MKKAFKVILLSQTLIYSSFVSATTACTCGYGNAEANGCYPHEICVVNGIECQDIPNNKGIQGECKIK